MSESSSETKSSPVPAAATSARTLLLAAGGALLVLLALIVSGLIENVWVQVIIMGVVQGLTEFLPISSTAHLLIAGDLLQFQYSIDGTFEIFIQLGTVVAVVLFYARELLSQARALPTSQAARRFWIGVALAFLPAAVIGLLLRDWIKTVVYESPIVIASTLILGGIVFLVLERLPQREQQVHDETTLSWGQALGVGFAQVMALIPGVSRSGASIVGGMVAGLDRRAATAFSFYLAIPTLGAATVVDLLLSLDSVTPADYARLLVGAVVAGIVGWLSIGWLLRYVATHSFVSFGIYRIVVGLLILALVAVGVLDQGPPEAAGAQPPAQTGSVLDATHE